MTSFRIIHRTRYRYSDKVFPEPHILRLTLRPDTHVSLISEYLKITPEPLKRKGILDIDGGLAAFISFKGMTDLLDIQAETVVSVKPFNPFDFLIYPDLCSNLPMRYPPYQASVLSGYISLPDTSELEHFISEIAGSSCRSTVTFIMDLCRKIHKDFRYEKRELGPPRPPAETLKNRKGSCRDFVVLAMAICRRMGLACRYVSGYCLDTPSNGALELHAWMEVFLPGAGWKGFDPAQGIACDQHFLVLSTSSDPVLTMPVTGSFRGDASCRMSTNIAVEMVTDTPA